MAELTDKGTSGKRLVLGFDGGCSTCSELARRIEERVGDKLEVLSLREPEVEEWRKKALGEDTPLVPTLFEIRGTEVRAWTGWRLGVNLSRFLGPVATWRVLQALDEAGEVSKALKPPAVGANLTRGQFLKGVGGAAVAMSVLSTTGKLVSPAGAVPRITVPGTGTRNSVVGASISHPAKWAVEREQYTLDNTYGFTLWAPEPGSTEDHGGEPVIRVALAYGLRPGQIERTVRAKLATYSHLPMRREQVSVGQRKLRGVAIGPIPGSTPSIEVYVPFGGRVYQINVYEERLSAEGRRLLSNLRFERPSRPVESLRLPNGKAPETFYQRGNAALIEREQAVRRRTASADSGEMMTASSSSVPVYNEFRHPDGCWTATSTFFFQTQHGMYANKRWGSRYMGWTRVGVPNYWGQYTHGSLGYGRCASPYYTNDMYAVDYPLGTGDTLFSPFKNGVVLFAGRNYTHKNYGIFVVIRADNHKYVNLSAHLNSIYPGIRRGVRVYDTNVIGHAGATGHSSIPVGEPHLHQAYYRYPRYNPDLSPYGGASLRVIYHHYYGTAARRAGYTVSSGVYRFAGIRPNYYAYCSENSYCGEGFWISN